MRIRDLKPKGSDKTFDEWIYICEQSECRHCEVRNECKKIGFCDISTAEDVMCVEVEA